MHGSIDLGVFVEGMGAFFATIETLAQPTNPSYMDDNVLLTDMWDVCLLCSSWPSLGHT
jgi:hypothetical protein